MQNLKQNSTFIELLLFYEVVLCIEYGFNNYYWNQALNNYQTPFPFIGASLVGFFLPVLMAGLVVGILGLLKKQNKSFWFLNTVWLVALIIYSGSIYFADKKYYPENLQLLIPLVYGGALGFVYRFFVHRRDTSQGDHLHLGTPEKPVFSLANKNRNWGKTVWIVIELSSLLLALLLHSYMWDTHNNDYFINSGASTISGFGDALESASINFIMGIVAGALCVLILLFCKAGNKITYFLDVTWVFAFLSALADHKYGPGGGLWMLLPIIINGAICVSLRRTKSINEQTLYSSAETENATIPVEKETNETLNIQRDGLKLGDLIPLINQKEVMQEEYPFLRKFLEKKTGVLWRHEVKDQLEKGQEPKNAYQSGFSPCDMASYDSRSGERFYLAWTATFGRMVFDYDYFVAFLKHQDSFGTGNADDVMSALFINENDEGKNIFKWDIKRFSEFLKDEECCYVVKREGDSFSDAFLRIDLFRMIKPDKDTPNKNEFIGGLFHVLDHFAFNGKNLGTGTDTFNVSSVEMVVKFCVEAFSNIGMINDNKAVGETDLDDSHSLRISFYRESESGAFYVKTAHPVRKQK